MTLQELLIFHSVKFGFWVTNFQTFEWELPSFSFLILSYSSSFQSSDLRSFVDLSLSPFLNFDWFFFRILFFLFSCMHAWDEGKLTWTHPMSWRWLLGSSQLLAIPLFLHPGWPKPNDSISRPMSVHYLSYGDPEMDGTSLFHTFTRFNFFAY